MTEEKANPEKKVATKTATTKVVTKKNSNEEALEKHLQLVQFVQNVVCNIETDHKISIKFTFNNLHVFFVVCFDVCIANCFLRFCCSCQRFNIFWIKLGKLG